jgi:protein-tyrosine kinase
VSLVEKALRKLQSAGGVPRAAGPVAGSAGRADPTADGVERPHPAAPIVRTGRRRLGTARPIEIHLQELRNGGILPPLTEERQLADEFRMIKRPLIEHAFKASVPSEDDTASPRSIIVTSALPGDGKTFTAINLALSLSREKDYSVILVDADVAKRDVSRMLGLTEAAGLWSGSARALRAGDARAAVARSVGVLFAAPAPRFLGDQRCSH